MVAGTTRARHDCLVGRGPHAAMVDLCSDTLWLCALPARTPTQELANAESATAVGSSVDWSGSSSPQSGHGGNCAPSRANACRSLDRAKPARASRRQCCGSCALSRLGRLTTISVKAAVAPDVNAYFLPASDPHVIAALRTRKLDRIARAVRAAAAPAAIRPARRTPIAHVRSPGADESARNALDSASSNESTNAGVHGFMCGCLYIHR
jgi:hypothetical protein